MRIVVSHKIYATATIQCLIAFCQWELTPRRGRWKLPEKTTSKLMQNSISISEKDNKRSIKVSLDTILVVSLSENPTAGFQWRIETSSHDVLTLEADDFSVKSGGGVGGGGVRRFQFRTIAVGHTAIRAKYRRSWDSEEEADHEFALDISVE
jgi:predicted secreted protein